MGVLPDRLCAAGRGASLPLAARPSRRRYTVASGRDLARPARVRPRPAREMAAPVQSVAGRRGRAAAQFAPRAERPRRLGRNPRERQTPRACGGKSRTRFVCGLGARAFAEFRPRRRHDRAAFGATGRSFRDAANAQDSCRGPQDARRFKAFGIRVKNSLRARQIFGRSCACRIRNSGVGFLA